MQGYFNSKIVINGSVDVLYNFNHFLPGKAS